MAANGRKPLPLLASVAARGHMSSFGTVIAKISAKRGCGHLPAVASRSGMGQMGGRERK
jgi:hypothetical protein